jgi:hypothetical protein
MSEGESRSEGHRILFQSPLGVHFQVQFRPPVVLIHKLWLFRQKGESE